MNISRRELLKWGAGTATALAAGVRPLAAAPKAKIPVGLQLYSVREACAKNLPPVLEAVARMGYQGVEFAGYYGRQAEELRKLLDQYGLKCCGTHIGLDTLRGDALKGTVEFNQMLGNKYLIVSYMPHKLLESSQTIKETGKLYNELAEKVKAQGLVVGYHAHGGDFVKVDGQTAWHLFFQNTNKDVSMQMDIGNCLGGGGDPIASLKKFPGRSLTVHLKEHGGKPEAVIGEGEVNWKEVFEICETTGGTQWYIVEHERSAGDPIDNVQRCLANIKKLGR